MGFGRTKSQSPKRSARSNLGEIPRYFRLQQLFPSSSSSSPHGPDLSACVLNSQVTSGLSSFAQNWARPCESNQHRLRLRPPRPLLRTATQSRIKSPRLGAVAANLHVAPTPRVVLALVQEEPSAGFFTALANAETVRRCQQIRGRVDHCPERPSCSSGKIAIGSN